MSIRMRSPGWSNWRADIAPPIPRFPSNAFPGPRNQETNHFHLTL